MRTPVVIRPKLTYRQLKLGIILRDRLLFRMFFFRDEMSQEPSLKQKLLFSDTSKFKLACTGRKVAKTLHIEAYIFQKAILARGKVWEGMFVTPGEIARDLVIDRVLSRLQREPIFMAFHKRTKRGEQIEFRNYRWYTPVEGPSGTERNMVGFRAVDIICDEMAFGNWGAYRGRIQSGVIECEWLYAGVPNGLRTTPFYAMDQTTFGRHFSIHRMTSYDNPMTWTPEARKSLLDSYAGGIQSQEYKTQCLGDWGDISTGSFDSERMTYDPESVRRYKILELRETDIIPKRAQVRDLLPLERPESLEAAVAGIDTASGGPDPWVMKVFIKKLHDPIWYDWCRITLLGIQNAIYPALITTALNEILGDHLVKICVDASNYGVAMIQKFIGDDISAEARKSFDWEGRFLRADFGSNHVVTQIVPGAGIQEVSIKNKQHYTDLLRNYLYSGLLLLSSTDDAQREELLGMTETPTTRAGNVEYHPPFGRNVDHITDALRAAARAIQANDEGDGLITRNVSALGWVPPPFGLPRNRTSFP